MNSPNICYAHWHKTTEPILLSLRARALKHILANTVGASQPWLTNVPIMFTGYKLQYGIEFIWKNFSKRMRCLNFTVPLQCNMPRSLLFCLSHILYQHRFLSGDRAYLTKQSPDMASCV